MAVTAIDISAWNGVVGPQRTWTKFFRTGTITASGDTVLIAGTTDADRVVYVTAAHMEVASGGIALMGIGDTTAGSGLFGETSGTFLTPGRWSLEDIGFPSPVIKGGGSATNTENSLKINLAATGRVYYTVAGHYKG